MTCDILLKNISMVFQKFYLLNYTILNNVKLGKPDVNLRVKIIAKIMEYKENCSMTLAA